MRAAEYLAGRRKPGRPIYDWEHMSHIYDDIWLLEQIASKIGIRQDLETIFSGNSEIVDDIIKLTIFPYITKFTYNRVARWQGVAAAPSTRAPTSAEITSITHIFQKAVQQPTSRSTNQPKRKRGCPP